MSKSQIRVTGSRPRTGGAGAEIRMDAMLASKGKFPFPISRKMQEREERETERGRDGGREDKINCGG